MACTTAREIDKGFKRDDFEKILIAHGIVPKKKEGIEQQPLA